MLHKAQKRLAKEIRILLNDGLTDQEIARELGIAVGTMKKHKRKELNSSGNSTL